MRLFKRRDRSVPPWCPWEELARYNAECARGISHANSWVQRMEDLQQDFDDSVDLAQAEAEQQPGGSHTTLGPEGL